MIANALNGFGQEQQIQTWRDGAWVFHHVGDELAHKTIKLLVDQIVFFQNHQSCLYIQARQGIEGLAQQARGQLRSHIQLRAGQSPGRATVDDGLDHACNFFSLITHPLQIGGGFGHGHEQAQIPGGGLAAPNHRGDIVVDLDFHQIDFLLDLDHCIGHIHIEVRKGEYGLTNLRLHQTAELHDPRGNAVQFIVKLTR